MLQTLNTRLSIAAALVLLAAMPASAAVVTRHYVISAATLADLYSATFDAPLTPCNVGTPPDAQECAFFNGYPPAGRNITITQNGTFPGSGTLSVDMESSTGEILQVNEMYIDLPDLTLVINFGGTTTVHVVQGDGLPVANDIPFIEAGTGTLGRDLDGGGGQTLLGLGTADPDQAPAIGQAAIFQHHDSGNSPDTPDFAVFNDIVQNDPSECSGPQCGLIFSYLITLDALRYRLEGAVSNISSANFSLVLKSQTANNSIYRVNLTAALDTDNDGTPDALDTDDDNDGRLDTVDNCSLVANNGNPGTGPAQNDADGDNYGNICDADLNQTNLTTASDYNILRAALNTNNANADLNGSGLVSASDYNILRARLNTAPGPSGYHPPLP